MSSYIRLPATKAVQLATNRRRREIENERESAWRRVIERRQLDHERFWARWGWVAGWFKTYKPLSSAAAMEREYIAHESTWLLPAPERLHWRDYERALQLLTLASTQEVGGEVILSDEDARVLNHA